ncbi:hypothetical protein [Xylanibacter rarus]
MSACCASRAGIRSQTLHCLCGVSVRYSRADVRAASRRRGLSGAATSC